MNDRTDPSLAALEWHLRLRDGGDADWATFTDWLAEHPDHGAAYDRIEAMDEALDHALPHLDLGRATPAASNDDTPLPSRAAKRWWWWAATGCGLAAALALTLFMRQGSSRYDVTTLPGEIRTVQLDAGTQVALNGDTHMTFDRKDPRFAQLAYGEALFRVQHDPQHPFTLTMGLPQTGQSRLVDIGTVFNVVSLPDRVHIAVAQGAVDYEPGGQAIALHAGQQMQADPQGRSVQTSPADSEAVGGWRHRRLTYAGEPLEQVAQDLSRMLGTVIRVDGAIARQPVYGTIDAQDITSARLPLVASALNVRVVRHGKEWILKPSHGPTR